MIQSSVLYILLRPQVMQLAIDIASKIPNCIDYDTTEKMIGAKKTPLDVVLLQEILRYNQLLNKTRNSLEDLQNGIKGLVLMSPELEDIFTCIYEGRVPSGWLRAYPSLKPLGSWTRDLVNRVKHFAKWAETTHPPLVFWLAAYTFPTGFLTAVLQTSARLWNISIDSLSWEFTVFSVEDLTITEPPTVISICYINWGIHPEIHWFHCDLYTKGHTYISCYTELSYNPHSTEFFYEKLLLNSSNYYREIRIDYEGLSSTCAVISATSVVTSQVLTTS